MSDILAPGGGHAPSDSGREMRSGGAILVGGALLYVVTVWLEVRLGWFTVSDLKEVAFMIGHWTALGRIWELQAVSDACVVVSALVLLRSRRLQGAWMLSSPLWSVVALGGLLAALAQVFTLGAYPPALAAARHSPEILATARGGAAFTYFTGQLAFQLGCLVLFVREGIAKDGVVPRSWLIGAGLVIAGSVVAGSTGVAQVPMDIVLSVVMAVLGLFLWRAGRSLSAVSSVQKAMGEKS